MRNAKTCTLALTLAAVLAGCSSTPVDNNAASKAAKTTQTASQPAPAAPAPVAAPEALAAHLDPNSAISKQRSVYFDFDDASVKGQFSSMLEQHGKYLVSMPSLTIKVEGNTDDRGSAEYNLALGQRRAESVVRALKIYGVKDNQVEAISWGEEKPMASGQTETAWSQNRRADLVYPTK